MLVFFVLCQKTLIVRKDYQKKTTKTTDSKSSKIKFSDKEIKEAKMSYYFDGALRLHLQILSRKS